MKYEEFKSTIVGKGAGLGTKEFWFVPKTLVSVSYATNQPKLEEYPVKSGVDVSMNKKGKKVIKFEDRFPDPNNVDFFFDKDEAEAYAVKLMTKQRHGLIRALEEFDRKTDYKGRFQLAFEKHPEVFI